MIYSIPKDTRAAKDLQSNYPKKQIIKIGMPGEILAKKSPNEYLVKFKGFGWPKAVTADEIEDNP